MSDPVHDRADVMAQLRMVLRDVERCILLLQPLQPRHAAEFEKLRRNRDLLEDAFTEKQAERLRQGSLDFAAEVDQLKEVTDRLHEAAERAARAREISGHVSTVVDISSRVAATVAAFL
jgi:hypothetical protein